MIRAALVQLSVTDDESVGDRTERGLAIAREVASSHDLVVFPELWHIGAFAIDLVPSHAEERGGNMCRSFSELAQATGAWIHGGSFAERADDGRFYNCSVVAAPDGSLAYYRKIHLFGFNGGEASVMTGGSEAIVVQSPLGVAGLSTCYDLRFPELYRMEQREGATAFIIPSGWPDRRAAHWSALARARAIENQAFVLGCNAAGTHAGVPMAGLSVILDPQGEVIAEAGTGEEILSAEIDPQRVSAWRAAFPALDDRRIWD